VVWYGPSDHARCRAPLPTHADVWIRSAGLIVSGLCSCRCRCYRCGDVLEKHVVVVFLATPDILFVHVTIGKTTRFNQHRMATRSLK
jgi:hypothetical protein